MKPNKITYSDDVLSTQENIHSSTASESASNHLTAPLPFETVAMLPQKGDSAALAKYLLREGTRIILPKSLAKITMAFDGNPVHDNEELPIVECTITLSAPCLEGYRFAIQTASVGEPLLSWGLPFGHATVEIRPGDILMNKAAFISLKGRVHGNNKWGRDSENEALSRLLDANKRKNIVNFSDLDVGPDHPFLIEENGGFRAVGMNRPLGKTYPERERCFSGYPRGGGRGVGTRNHAIVLALTSSAAPTVHHLSNRWKHYEYETPIIDHDEASADPNRRCRLRNNFDGVRVVAHTEGECSIDDEERDVRGAGGKLRNITHIHRCLAGFLCHPNVGSAVVVTTGRERHITKDTLIQFVKEENEKRRRTKIRGDGCDDVYPMECFMEPFAQWIQIGNANAHPDVSADTVAPLNLLDEAVSRSVTHAAKIQRQPCKLSHLTLALQCGGSDAFSGLTGNPLAGDIASSLIHSHASKAILAESPELIGAEPYILSRVANENVAKQFIRTTERYKAYAARHGQSAAGNPSGGNLYRGLYNIVLKSLGAARKKSREVSLDCVLEYGEPMRGYARGEEAGVEDVAEGGDNGHFHASCTPHYAFMDSPGNDLESIAGQVASGCNLILFITGNGAMTNFPFVPTLKIVTTTKRYLLLQDEMDIDAGPYGDGGEYKKKSTKDGVERCIDVASGDRSKGEEAGHSQVSLWRNWAVGEDGEEDNRKCNRKSGEENGHIHPKKIDGTLERALHEINDSKGPSSVGLQLCVEQEPYAVRTDAPPLPEAFLREPPVRRAKGCDGNEEGISAVDEGSSTGIILRPWKLGSSCALVPTSLCSSAVAASIRDAIIQNRRFSPTSHDSMHIVCPSHTEGCGAAGDEYFERMYQRLLLGNALHPSIRRVMFLEHGCEKTHNDYMKHCLCEAGVLPSVRMSQFMEGSLNEKDSDDNGDGGYDQEPEMKVEEELEHSFGFWSLQNDGGYENAKKGIADFFLRENGHVAENKLEQEEEEKVDKSKYANGCFPSLALPSAIKSKRKFLFDVPWHDRPIAVGIFVHSPAVATTVKNMGSEGGVLLASALASVIRLLSRLGVNSVLPINSPLVSMAELGCDEKTVVRDECDKLPFIGAGASIGVATSSGDIEDICVPLSQFNKAYTRGKTKSRSNPTQRRLSSQQEDDEDKERQERGRSISSSIAALFAAETIMEASIPLHATMLPGQIIGPNLGKKAGTVKGGLHIMDTPRGSSWDETLSCLAPACDVILLVALARDMLTLPGSCLSPTLRKAIPVPPAPSSVSAVTAQSWKEWTEETCINLLEVLRSPLVCGGTVNGSDNGKDLGKMISHFRRSLFSLTTFVVPRGNAVSL